MSDLIAIPPKVRTVIYYVLGVANVANLSLLAAQVGDTRMLLVSQGFVSGLSGLFFGVAASNVVGEPAKAALVDHDPVVQSPPFD